MTLILTLSAPLYVLQVTDRLVTAYTFERDPKTGTMIPTPPRQHDPIANKNILYYARDAVVTMGYTGDAYFDGLPTDRWLVQKLVGRVLSGDAAVYGHFGKKPLHWLDLGQALQTVKTELTTVVSRLHRNRRKTMAFGLMVSGWQWNSRGRARPIFASVTRDEDDRNFRIYRYPRRWYWEDPERADRRFRTRYNAISKAFNTLVTAAPAVNITQAEIKSLWARVQGMRPDAAEESLVAEIRRVAARNPYVGQNCMSVFISAPGWGHIRVRYAGQQFRQAIVDNRLMAIGYSPWLVGPYSITAPALVTGTWQTEFGPYQLTLDAPHDPQGALLQYQPRVPPLKRWKK